MTREEIVNEYLKEHRHDVLLNPYAGLLDFAKFLDEQSKLPADLEEAAEKYRRNTCNEACKQGFLDNHPSPSIKSAFIDGVKWKAVQDHDAKLKELADNMYSAAQYLTTDASRLHKAMEEYHNYTVYKVKL